MWCSEKVATNIPAIECESPGLVVMGDDSSSRGHGFEPSALYWMVMTFFHIYFL